MFFVLYFQYECLSKHYETVLKIGRFCIYNSKYTLSYDGVYFFCFKGGVCVAKINELADSQTPTVVVVDGANDKKKKTKNNVVSIKNSTAEVEKIINKMPADIKELLRDEAVKAVGIVLDLMYAEDTPPGLRLKCAETILDRSYGKATQPIDANMNAGIEIKLGKDVEEYSQ
jgi:hypothetical protein